MTWAKAVLRLVTAAIIILAGCGPPVAPASPTSAPAPKGEPKAAPKEPGTKASVKDVDATAKYEALVQAAKKEGKITVSNSQAFVREALRDSFGKKFGIDVEFLHLMAADLVTRVGTERQAGQYTLDVVLSGPGTFILSMIPEGMIDPLDDVLILPEVTDPSKWLDGKIPWNDPERKVLRSSHYVQSDLSINTSVVKKDEIKSFKDLLNPKWKGKIAGQDPTVLGAGGVIGSFLLLSFGEDFLKQLYLGQEVALSREYRQMEDWLARGRYPLMVWGSDPGVIAKLQQDGLPVDVVITDDVGHVDASWGALAMLNKAPHPNAAKLFVNWFASKEGQEMWVKVTGRPVTRTDVNVSALPDYLKLKPGGKYVDSASYEYLTKQRADAQNKVRELIQR